MHLTRYFMYKRMRQFFQEPMSGKILGISGIADFYPLMDTKKAELTEVAYPAVDMQQLPFEDSAFDFVISDQVIEHLEDPARAVRESCRVLKEGGTAIHTTCFMNYIHPSPLDFWRFSPAALRWLCRDFSQILVCEGWGNRIALLLCFISDRLRFMNIPDARISIRRRIATWNEERYPIVTWVIARK